MSLYSPLSSSPHLASAVPGVPRIATPRNSPLLASVSNSGVTGGGRDIPLRVTLAGSRTSGAVGFFGFDFSYF